MMVATMPATMPPAPLDTKPRTIYNKPAPFALSALRLLQSVTQVKDFLAQLLHPQYAPNNDFCAVFLLEQPPATAGAPGAAEADSASATSSSARDAAGIREAALRAKDAIAMAHETHAFLTGEHSTLP